MDIINKKNEDHNDLITLELDKPRNVVITNGVLKRFCALTGTTLSGIGETIDSYDNLILLLWCALVQEDKDLSREKLDELLEPVKVGKIMNAVTAAVEAAFDDGEQADPQTKAAGTGVKA